MQSESNFTNILSGLMEENGDFIPIFSDEDEDEAKADSIPDVLPILPLRNTVLFPGVVIPISVGRDKSLRLVREAYEKDGNIGALAQKAPKYDNPNENELYRIGTVGKIIKILEMPDDSTTVILQGRKRFQLEEIVSESPYHQGRVTIVPDPKPVGEDKEFDAIIGSLKDLSIEIINLSQNIPTEATFAIKNIENPSFLINFISSNSNVKTKGKQNLLEVDDLKERASLLLEHLVREVQELKLKDDIQSKVKSELDQQQREYLLNQQIKTIQNELGSSPIEVEVKELREKATKKQWNEDVARVFDKELTKIERINPASPEYSNQLNYLQVLIDLPWNEYTQDNFDLKRAQKILDEDHFGLEKVKERILEHLAVLKLKGDLKAPIICLYGPPGVGKTSLGRSIAKALDRKYVRMALGGLHDEAEIRGHRKTYIGALPGRIIQNIKKVKSSNPVFILDEIDKIGNDFRGDPSFALLEVLDPEQNNTFYDNYLELEYDLSKVMFIATANTLGSIKPALRDRMEMINVNGYIVEEKVEIARRHLLPKQLELHGVKKSQLSMTKKVLEHIVEHYTRESGVRELDKRLAKVVRNIAKKIGFEEEYNVRVSQDDVRKILGAPIYKREKYQGNDMAGVVTGLAWTASGGEILFIETSLSKSKNAKLTLTGNLGDVMKESAVLALEFLKSHASQFDIPQEAFDNWNVHVHVPEGAIPKDGPSAGVTMVTSLASAFTQRKVRASLAMTGEITLRGKVLPVGGIKEKILAAKRADIKEIILSSDNEKDVSEIKDIYLKGLTFHYVDTISDVLEIALLQQKVSNAINLA